jgi:hypothetical protein
MTCQRCSTHTPLTYRNVRLGIRAICGPCLMIVEPYPVIAWQGWVLSGRR